MRKQSRWTGRVARVVSFAMLTAMGIAPIADESMSTASAAPTASSPSPGLASLADCVRSGRGVLVLFLIDESGSLKQTDPTNQRVTAVKTALEGLAGLQQRQGSAGRGDTQVQLDGFSVGFDTVTAWSTLRASTLATVKGQADQFATRNTGQDTDYYAALDGARQALADRAASAHGTQPCKAIFWFTDGQYDIIDRVTPQQISTLGATKAYAPDIRLDAPGGGQQLIGRGKQLLCQPGGLVDRLSSEQVVTVAVALDTQISPENQAFLTSVATGQGCGTATGGPTGASLSATDLGALIFSFNAVANTAAGGTALGNPASVTPCPGKPCTAGARKFHVDPSLHRVHGLVATGNDNITIAVRGPHGEATLSLSNAKSGTVTIGNTKIRFVWLDQHTCSLDALLGDDAVGNWSITLIGSSQATLIPGTIQLHVYADVTPKILQTPTIRLGHASRFDVALINSAGTTVSNRAYRKVTLNATATNPIDGQRQPLDVHAASDGHFSLSFPLSHQLPSVVIVQLTILVITIDGIELVPIQRSYRVPVQLPPQYPRFPHPDVALHTPQATTGSGGIAIIGGTKPACVWIDTTAPHTQTPGTDVAYNGASSQHTCLKVNPGQPTTIDFSATATPATPGTIHTSIILNILIVHVHITLLIPVTFAITTAALPTSGGNAQRIVSLGDSYSSGEGNPPFDTGTDTSLNHCHRSAKAWPRLIGVTADNHLACSGAKTNDVFSATRPAPDNTSQIDRLRALNAQRPVDTVTLTIGGNDVGFSKILSSCYLHSCLKHPEQDRTRIGAMADDLITTVLPALKTAAPNATIVLVGYPRLFPTAQSSVTHCAWLDTRERELLNDLATYLDQHEQQAARVAHVEYVSVLNALQGHELCSRDPWVWPVSATDCNPVVPVHRNFCGHPTETGAQHGQVAIAKLVRAALQRGPQPTTNRDGAYVGTFTSSDCSTEPFGSLHLIVHNDLVAIHATTDDTEFRGHVDSGGAFVAKWASGDGNPLFLEADTVTGTIANQRVRGSVTVAGADACNWAFEGTLVSRSISGPAGIQRFVGGYYTHSGNMAIDASGLGRIMYRAYAADPSADLTAEVEFHIVSISGDVAHGLVDSTTYADPIPNAESPPTPKGPITLRITGDGIVNVEPPGLPYCTGVAEKKSECGA